MKTIGIIGSCDTKFKEVAYMREIIEREGIKVLVIDVATGSGVSYGFDISREEVVKSYGILWCEIESKTKGEKIEFMMHAVASMAEKLYMKGKIHGLLSVGGLQNTIMATNAMQRLPIGFPKVMATTVACGQRAFDMVVGDKDIVVIPSITDFTGLNIVTRQIIANACACCVGMVKSAGHILEKDSRLIVGVTLMGITNEGACAAIEELERLGVDALGFHTTGVGGPTMEKMVEEGLIDGVLDLTTHEIAEEYFGRGFSYGIGAKYRLVKSIENRVPLIACPGGLDFCDFAVGQFPERMNERVYMLHNGSMAHIKLTPDEALEIAERFVERLNKADYPIKVLLPTDGMRHNTQKGQELYCEEVDNIIISTIKEKVKENVEVIEISGNLDTKAWGVQAAQLMYEELKKTYN